MLYNLESDIDIQRFDFRIKQLKEKKSKVDLTEKKKNRTIRQNSFLHVLIQLFAIEYGDTLDYCKQFLKLRCQFMHYEKDGFTYLISSAKLNTKELSEWIEWIRNYAGTNGIFLPNADDYNRNWVELEKEILSHKQYL